MKSLFSKEKWQQLFYTVSHPSDGFYWIRHGEKGSVAIATGNFAPSLLPFPAARLPRR